MKKVKIPYNKTIWYRTVLAILSAAFILCAFNSCKRDDNVSVDNDSEFQYSGNNYIIVKNTMFEKVYDIKLVSTAFAEKTKTKINSKLRKVDYYADGAFKFDSTQPGSINIVTGGSGTTNGGQALLIQLGLYPSVNVIFMDVPTEYKIDHDVSINNDGSRSLIHYKTYNNIPIISDKTKIEIVTDKNKLSKLDYCWSNVEAVEKSSEKTIITARKAVEVYDEFIRKNNSSAENAFKDKNIVCRPVFFETDNGFRRAWMIGELGAFYGSVFVDAETSDIL